MTPDASLARRARETALELTSWPSVTGTPGEAEFPGRLAELLRRIPYFAAHPGDLTLTPVPGGAHQRRNLFALARGSGARTVILAGHFDVVGVDDYGDLAPLAGESEELRVALVSRLRAAGGHPLALADLEGGGFLPGRGMLDMKSGLAAGIAVLEEFCARGAPIGNLLLIATPDEENRSEGMRAAAAALPAYLAGRGLTAELAVNLDATCDNGDGAQGRTVFMGSIGKSLLSALVVGKESHACYPFDGVSAAYLAAALVTAFEWAPGLSETTDGELAAPPAALGLKDLKTQYNVTTPGRAWAFWNVLAHRRGARGTMAAALEIARDAVARSTAQMRARAAAVGAAAASAWDEIETLTFAECFARAGAADPGFPARFKVEAGRMAREDRLDFPARSLALTELAWNAAGARHPAVILGFASLPYPAIAWRRDARGRRLEASVAAGVASAARRCGVAIGAAGFFPGISDMSFLGPVDTADLAAGAGQTPLWGAGIDWDLSAGGTPGIPVINAGPWGRDYHHWLERAHEDYAFRVLPVLVRAIADEILAGGH